MYGSNLAENPIDVRMKFLRKVYGLLTLQLLLTIVVAGSIAYTPVLRDVIFSFPLILVMCILMSLILLIVLHIKRHQFPINCVLLTAFTVMMAMMVGATVSLYEVEVVIKAIALTLVITISLTLYTFQTKSDFTNIGSVLIIGLMIIIGVGLMNLFIRSTELELVLAGVSAFIFSLYIVFDTQMMMKKISPDEYIVAVINLYLDIINLFINLLRIINGD